MGSKPIDIYSDVSILKINDIIVLLSGSDRYGIPEFCGNRFKVFHIKNENRVEILTLDSQDPSYQGSTWYFGNDLNIQFTIEFTEAIPKEVVKDKPLISEQGKWFRDSGLAPGYCACGVAKEVCEFHK
jgi:hypothetical protein